MVLHLSMIIYPGGGRKKVPAHWGIMAAPQENGPVGTVYHAIEDPFRGYNADMKEEYDISKTNRRYIRVSLGKMDEQWVTQVRKMAPELPAPGASSTPLDPFAVSVPSSDCCIRSSCFG